MEKRNVPVKNYVVLAFLILATVFLTFQLSNKYKKENAYYKNNSPLYGVLYELKLEDFDNYLLDNPNVVIYIVDGNDNDSNDMDNIIKELVLENNLTHDFVVVDVTTNLNPVKSKLNSLLHKNLNDYKRDLFIQTNLLVVKDRKVEDILVPKTKDKEIIIDFLTKNGVM